MRRAIPAAALAAALLAAGPAAASPERAPVPRVAFVAASDGPLAPTADEVYAGLRAGLGGVEVVREAPKKPGAWDALFAEFEKRGVTAAVAELADGETAAVEKAAEKAKVPLLVLSHEETRADLDPLRAVFWAGGLRPTDEALAAMDFALMVLGLHEPAILHDGSARGVEAATKCLRMHHASQKPRAPAPVATDFGVADVKGLLGSHANKAPGANATSAGQGADGILYFGGPAAAERLLAACAAAKIDAPVLLGQGLATRGVPSFAEGRATSAWALEPAYFEDYVDGKGSPAVADLPELEEVAKHTGGHLYASTIRGWRTGKWIAEAIRVAEKSPEKKAERRFPWALRSLAREAARGKPVFETWGHACLARAEAWRCAKGREEPVCSRIRPAYMPMTGIPQIGFFSESHFTCDTNGFYVWMHWGKPEERTIEKDLAALGLSTGGHDPEMDARLVEDLMGRTISRLNRLFLRNPDGTPIPGVSFNVTFGTEKEPTGLKGGRRFEMVLRGDSEIAGGVAHGTSSEVFTTYIRRTIYEKVALTPPVAAADRVHFFGQFRWGSVLAENLRADSVRALADGYTQGFALTGSHEAGHMFGLGHDETTPRSIMNVAEAVGLDFEWAEWCPEHVKILETRLGRVPGGNGR